jgi:hypothetical protein
MGTVSSLPLGTPVELEIVFEVADPPHLGIGDTNV